MGTNIQVKTIDQTTVNIEPSSLEKFKTGITGKIILPTDEEFEDARLVWNGMIDQHPAMIAHCKNAQDVITTVNFAREHRLLTAVRGGGHNVAGLGTCAGGLVIDLSAINQVELDLERKVAIVGGGAKWGDVDPVTQAYGLATPGGVVSDTGVAGLTLGGGFGHIRNKFGLTCDNLLAVEMVTAQGELIRASETENRELLWGLRGGGGNFGVVTRFDFQLHPLGPEVFLCFVFHHGEDLADAFRFFRDFSQNAPDEVSALAFSGIFPDGSEAFPPEAYGKPFIAFMGVYAGEPEKGESAFAPLQEYAQPVTDYSGKVFYKTAQSILDEDYPSHEMRYYWKSINIMKLDEDALNIISEYARLQPSQFSTTDLWHIGRAVKKVSEDHAAFNGRHASFLLNIEANWIEPEDDQANIEWVREFLEKMKPHSDGSLYLNFAGLQEEGESMMKSAYGPQYARLAALKTKYDPQNLFRLNHNIQPRV